jgi:hypothetical protein
MEELQIMDDQIFYVLILNVVTCDLALEYLCAHTDNYMVRISMEIDFITHCHGVIYIK